MIGLLGCAVVFVVALCLLVVVSDHAFSSHDVGQAILDAMP
jgi:hypothetical protein